MKFRRYVLSVTALFLSVAVPASGVTLAATHQASSTAGGVLVAKLKALPGYAGSAHARLVINPGQRSVCYKISTTGVTEPVMMAHIHAAATGNIVVTLFESTANPAATIFKSCVHPTGSTTRSLLKTILGHPSRYYVQVHTTGMTPILKGTLTKPGTAVSTSNTSGSSSSGSSGYGYP